MQRARDLLSRQNLAPLILAALTPAWLASCGSKFSAAGDGARGGTAGDGSGGASGESGATDGGASGRGASAGYGGASGSGGSAGGKGGAAGRGGQAGSGTTGNGGEAGGGVTVPPTCDPGALVDGCIPSDDGIFVSPSGSDDNDGSAAAPLATVSAAVTLAASSGAPVYVCSGTFDEHVLVSDDGLSLHGGFACPEPGESWVYDSSQRARIAPTTAGYALHVSGALGLSVSDLELESANATIPGESSIAVFVTRSSDVSLTRVHITAGDGVNGVNGTRDESNQGTTSVAGNNASGNIGGLAKVCVCVDETMSVGGGGGKGGLTPMGGEAGSPDLDGGRAGTPGACNTVGTGGNGNDATPPPDGTGAMTHGTLTASGWTPAHGNPGANGAPGQGGGGGAGATTGGGGGGACGGCGGKGGGAGTGGGGSIGLAAVRSTVVLDTVTISTGTAGTGGAGIEGEMGQDGGPGGTKTSLACNGGNGGRGANGAAGGGGAGGVSVGILFTPDSTVTRTDSTNFDIGVAGAGGPAATGSDNAGVPGVEVETLEATG